MSRSTHGATSFQIPGKTPDSRSSLCAFGLPLHGKRVMSGRAGPRIPATRTGPGSASYLTAAHLPDEDPNEPKAARKQSDDCIEGEVQEAISLASHGGPSERFEVLATSGWRASARPRRAGDIVARGRDEGDKLIRKGREQAHERCPGRHAGSSALIVTRRRDAA